MERVVFYPIYIYTINREIKRVDCPIICVIESGVLTSIRGYIPEQLEDYLIYRVPEHVIDGGEFLNEYEFWQQFPYLVDYGNVPIGEVFNYDEFFISGSGARDFIHDVTFEASRFRQGNQRYDIPFSQEGFPNTPNIFFGFQDGLGGVIDVVNISDLDSITLEAIDVNNPDFEIVQQFNLYVAHEFPAEITIADQRTLNFEFEPDSLPYNGILEIIHIPSGLVRSLTVNVSA